MQYTSRLPFAVTGTFLLLAVLLAPSCKTTRGPGGTAATKSITAVRLLDELKKNQLQAEWMDARARISFDGEDMKVSGTANIKWRKDSLIWLNVKKFGFEAARAQITPDSIYILDRLNNEYSVEPLSYIEKRYKLPARFDLLQSIFLGNPVFFTTRLMLDENKTERYHLSGTSDSGMKNEYWLGLQDFGLQKMAFSETNPQRHLSLDLQDYQTMEDGRQFSYLRLLEIDSKETGKATVEIEFKEVVLDVPTEFIFDVPARYSR